MSMTPKEKAMTEMREAGLDARSIAVRLGTTKRSVERIIWQFGDVDELDRKYARKMDRANRRFVASLQREAGLAVGAAS